MLNEQMVRERLAGIARIERAVEQGQNGLIEVREMYEQGVIGADIVRMLKEDVRKIVLAAFIDNVYE